MSCVFFGVEAASKSMGSKFWHNVLSLVAPRAGLDGRSKKVPFRLAAISLLGTFFFFIFVYQ